MFPEILETFHEKQFNTTCWMNLSQPSTQQDKLTVVDRPLLKFGGLQVIQSQKTWEA